MVRKVAYGEVGGYIAAKNRFRMEDLDFWILMYDKGFQEYNLPEPLRKMLDD